MFNYVRIRPVLLALMLCLGTGCFDMQADLTINEDGSGHGAIGYAISESILNGGPFNGYLNTTGGPNILDGNKLVEKVERRGGINVKNLDLWMNGDMQYVRMHVDFEHISRLGDDSVRYSWDLENGAWVYRIIIAKRNSHVNDSALQQPLIKGFQDQGFHYTVHLPGRIVESNAKEVNWNVAKFFIPLGHYFQKDAPTKVFYAKVEASTWERVKAWFLDLIPD